MRKVKGANVAAKSVVFIVYGLILIFMLAGAINVIQTAPLSAHSDTVTLER